MLVCRSAMPALKWAMFVNWSTQWSPCGGEPEPRTTVRFRPPFDSLRLDLVSTGRGRRWVAHPLSTAPLWIGDRHRGQGVDNPANGGATENRTGSAFVTRRGRFVRTGFSPRCPKTSPNSTEAGPSRISEPNIALFTRAGRAAAHAPRPMSFGDAAFEMGDVPSAKHTEVFAGQRHPGPLPVRPRCWPRPWIMRVPARPPCRRG